MASSMSFAQNFILQNKIKTYLILFFFVLFVGMIGFIVGKGLGYGNLLLFPSLAVSLISSLISYYYGDKLILKMSGGQKAHSDKYPQLFEEVKRLSQKVNIAVPVIYISPEKAPNAFTTGRDPNHASICVTYGLLQMMSKSELSGVLGHELTHIVNLDTRLMMIISVLIGFAAFLSDWFIWSLVWGGRSRNDKSKGGGAILLVVGIIFSFLAPISATLIQLTVSRNREYLADAESALLTQHPQALASALTKIAGDIRPLEHASNATAHLYFSNPFHGKESPLWFSSLFNTHPPIEQRIKVLKDMSV